jgi:hypothetical protein
LPAKLLIPNHTFTSENRHAPNERLDARLPSIPHHLLCHAGLLSAPSHLLNFYGSLMTFSPVLSPVTSASPMLTTSAMVEDDMAATFPAHWRPIDVSLGDV